MAISGNQWQSAVISGNPWQSVAISGNQRGRWRSTHSSGSQSVAIRGNPWQSVAISGNQWQSAPERILPFEIVWVHRGVIKSTRVHSVAISAHHLPFEIAWVNCGTDKREHETTPHMPHAPVMREAIRGHRRLSEAIRDNSPDAACTVHCAGVHWVVNLHSDHHLGGGAVHAAAHSADDDSSPRHHGRTAGSDGDEPR